LQHLSNYQIEQESRAAATKLCNATAIPYSLMFANDIHYKLKDDRQRFCTFWDK